MDKIDNKNSFAMDICKMLKDDNKKLFIINIILIASFIASAVFNIILIASK